MKIILSFPLIFVLITISCTTQKPAETKTKPVHLITLDPGHFHAALVQKSMYDDIDSVVNVYAKEGPDLQWHLDRIEAFNKRIENPTHWVEKVYSGNDFFEKMILEKPGNVIVIAGNNLKKTEYLSKSLAAGFHVLADKPMVIDAQGFEVLKNSFETAKQRNVLLYDIMTERFEITTRLQKEFSMIPEVFGTLVQGTADAPAVTKESVHYFHKYVSGKILTRPPWFMDVTQAGEGIVDVTTHLVDLVQWECFPELAIDYANDIRVTGAKRWATDMTLSQFKAITKLGDFPDYLKQKVVNDSILPVYCNGEINYTLRGVNAKVSVRWNYKAPEGAGDSHYSILRGSKANLVIRQGEDQHFIPALYVEPVVNDPSFEPALSEHFKAVLAKYPGIYLKKVKDGWEVVIPDSYRDGHEAHFGRVMANYLEYVKNNSMPAWEVPNMLAKYYTTTQALELAKKK